jgi:DNA-binding NtrC family response regulator
MQATQTLPLSGVRILLVEDEYYIADDLQRTLTAAGAEIVGPFPTLARASDAVDAEAFDCAVIDLNLQGESAVSIADRLTGLGKSFAIATGYGSSALPERLRQVPRIEKPFDPRALLQLVSELDCARD